MKVSDYIIKFIENLGVKDVFLLAGGGMMHLLDSLAKSSIQPIYNLNEQATTMCGDAYAQYTNDMSVCMVTTGPGGTNAITGVVSAYQDSTPMLVLSGQVKTTNLAPEGVRVYGAQEVNITKIVQTVTKYAVTIMKVEDVRYCLEKAVYMANNGRRGPVWVDVPLDIQATDINESELKGYNPEMEEKLVSSDIIDKIYNDLKSSKRPAILLGHGVVAAKADDMARELAYKMQIPILTTWRAKEIFRENEDIFFGAPGSQAARYSNLVLQQSDFLLVVGSRLDWSLTAFNEPDFARRAKKYIVDIEQPEMDKLDICFEEKICCDARTFIEKFSEKIYISNYKFDDEDGWMKKAKEWKGKYSIYNERQDIVSNGIWGYDFGKTLTTYADENDVFVASPTGRVCIAMNLGIQLKGKQRFVGPRGLGSMGYALPSAIGACLASGLRRTICFEGDGSLQHNIQELQLLLTYKLPIKLFIYNNGGYSSIYGMQGTHFKGNLAGCNAETGVVLPEVKKIAEAYGIKYDIIKTTDELEEGMKRVLADNVPTICEIIGDIRYEEIPRTQTRVHEDGTITSSSMEDLYPFIEYEM